MIYPGPTVTTAPPRMQLHVLHTAHRPPTRPVANLSEPASPRCGRLRPISNVGLDVVKLCLSSEWKGMRDIWHTVRKGVVRNHRHPPCKAVSLASRCSSTFSSSTPPLIYTAPIAPIAPIAPTAALYGSNMTCTPIRKTSRREYEMPRRSRFRVYLKEGHSVARATQLTEVPRSTIRGWISTGDR